MATGSIAWLVRVSGVDGGVYVSMLLNVTAATVEQAQVLARRKAPRRLKYVVARVEA